MKISWRSRIFETWPVVWYMLRFAKLSLNCLIPSMFLHICIVVNWLSWGESMFLDGEKVDAYVEFLAASNNLLKFMPDTSIGLTGCVEHGANVVCAKIESLDDFGCSCTGGLIRGMASDCSALIMLRHGENNVSVFSALRVGSRF